MKIVAVLLLLIVPVALAGDFAKLWAKMEQSIEKEIFEDYDSEDSPRVGDNGRDGWGDSEPKGWGESKHRGWGSRKQSRDQDDTKENVQDLVIDFKQYVRRKAMKENEEKNSKAEIYRQMERVHMKKMLTDKLEELTQKYEEQRIKFAFQTVWHFMGLCPEEGNAKGILQKLDGGNFADELFAMNDTLSGNMNDINSGNMNDTSNGNSTIDELMSDPSRVRWFVEMPREDKVKYALHGFMMVMCGAAQQLAGEIELLQWRVKECQAGRTQCDLSP